MSITADDVVFVAGAVEIQGSLDGVGTILATGDVHLRASTAVPAVTTRLSIVSRNDVKVARERRFRGALHAARDVVAEQGAILEGVLIAGRKIHLKKQTQLRFVSFDTLPPLITVTHPVEGSTVRDELLSVRGTVLDASGVASVTVGGVAAVLSGETFSAMVDLAPGANRLTVSASDGAGNTG